ncbi:MAG TPA: hypothetical protein VKA94_12850, partial [Hyphomicrobiales bacterium]|nr:hypothetical protein [Hyphomicrobiales bacterium]
MKATRLLRATAALSLLAGTSAAIADPVSLNIDDINQITTHFGTVVNYGDIDLDGVLSGNGSSLSISATGAVSSASVSFIDAPEFDAVTIGILGNDEIIQQRTWNFGDVRNWNGFGTSVETGNVSGNGASVSVSATGAASAVSVSSIENTNANQDQNITFGGINQRTLNIGTVQNHGGHISTGNISGTGASVSIGGSGAVSAVSVSSILDSQQLGDVSVVADINQRTTNV